MHLLDRFSTHVREVLAKSIRLATELKNHNVEPIHLFFALANQKGSVAQEIINRLKLNPKTMEEAIFSLPVDTGALKAIPVNASSEHLLASLSLPAKTAVEKALLIAQENNHNFMGTEHLLTSLIRIKDKTINSILQTNKVKIADIEKQLSTILANASQFPQLTEAAQVMERLQENVGEIPPAASEFQEQTTEEHVHKKGKKKQTALDFFAVNLTGKDTDTTIDPVIGREVELERIIHILCRRTKNNPILLGDPGVGKTAIVEGLAKKILEGNVPDILQNKKIYALDMGMLIAGTIYRGEFEGRLKQVIEEVTSNPDIILFIDEIHNIVGAGSNQGTMDAANILKPALSRGQIRCIGATTPQEFKKYIESDPALERRFQPIFVKEPSVENTIQILKGIKSNYEVYHQVAITDEAVEAAVELADRYIAHKFLPDKAIDLMDEAAAGKRLTLKSNAWQNKLARTRQRLEKVIASKEEAAQNDKFAEAVKFKDQEEKLRLQIKQLEKEGRNKKLPLLGAVTAHDVRQQLSRITGISSSDLWIEEPEKLHKINEELKKVIVGQDHIVDDVIALIRQGKLGISHPDRPLASFLFIGDSGVGKTELAKKLAEKLYPGRDALIKLDMSEYNESFGVSKLLGSPAGYVGYKEHNQFTDKIKMNPHCIVIFDEIDKAHRDVTKLLLQILENGEITDSTGKKTSLKHAIIILTTTFGAEDIKKGGLGFDKNSVNNLDNLKLLTEKLKEFFSPEIINRLDKICLFNSLNIDNLAEVAHLEVAELNSRLKKYHTSLTVESTFFKNYFSSSEQKFQSAREVRIFVRTIIEKLMSEAILQKKIKPTYTLAESSNHTLTIK
jgi:ATP-dependent Clp protease ATP-binding subunit ClpC